jgi:uncharacterized protein (DUF952 family)/ribosomal protein S18 acetylase RimI-like enzyme
VSLRPDVLLHLTDTATWRTALRDGALPPAGEGFVHLSRPEQVHLPAQRLFPGRRDLVLLVVDPARLEASLLRAEPGAPGDPDGMLFPHFHGSLPVTAVIATAPYRPPSVPVLPEAGDALGRTLALYLAVTVRRAQTVLDVPGGLAVGDRRFPHSRAHNRLLLSEPTDAGTVAELSSTARAELGWSADAATLRWPAAGEVARELLARGWDVEELLLMARPGAPLPGPDRAEAVHQREVHDLWARSWRAGDGTARPQPEEVVEQLVGREYLNDLAVRVHDAAVREAGRVVAAGQLYVDGATAAVESVLTDHAARGRGHADAVLTRLVVLAVDAGCDLVVLEAAADDWPREWYARRGFRVVGSTWIAVRTDPGR